MKNVKELVRKTITWDEFEETYKPKQSGREEFNGWLYETFGEDEAYVAKMGKKNPNCVWTILDCGHMVITSGWHYVNRYGYIITEKPWKDGEDITVEDQEDKEHEARYGLTVEKLTELEGGSREYRKLLEILFSIYEEGEEADEALSDYMGSWDVGVELDGNDEIVKVHEKPKVILATIILDFYGGKRADLKKAIGDEAKLIIKNLKK